MPSQSGEVLMSELKAKHVVDVYDEYSDNPTNEAQVYIKSEADKVIAENDQEIAELEERIADGDKDFEMVNNQNERLIKTVLHHKHKRCLAMAQVLEHVCPITNRKAKWQNKWHKRWLELAEKFKEAK